MPNAKTNKRKTNKRKKMVGGENNTNLLELFDENGKMLNNSGILNDDQKETFNGIIALILNKGLWNTFSKGLANVVTTYLQVRNMNIKTAQLEIIFDKNKPQGLVNAEQVKKKFLYKFSHTTDKNLLDAYVFLLGNPIDVRDYKYKYDEKNKEMQKVMKRVNVVNNMGFDGKNPLLNASSLEYDESGQTGQLLDTVDDGDENDNQNNNEGGKTVKNRKLKQTRKKAKTNRKKHQKQSRRK